jgi:hypothetical protein
VVDGNLTGNWQTRLIQPRWGRPLIRPADIGSALQSALLTREGILEDANYQKVVPNHFIIEVSQESYQASYQPIEQRIVRQWTEKLLEYLMTVNSRMGRKEYAFGGRVQIEMRPSPELTASQVRIHYRVEPKTEQSSAVKTMIGCLERLDHGQRFSLTNPLITLGRDPECDIPLDQPDIVEQRLVSSRHAYLRREGEAYWLFDGSTDGRPSLNGTYVNQQRISTSGRRLKDNDLIILAAVNPDEPTPDTPGVASFRFIQDC